MVVIATAKLYSTKPELRFCTGSNPACGVSEIHDGEDLWQWSRLAKYLLSVNHTTKTIHHHYHPVSHIAKLFQCFFTKAAYVATYGLATYLQDEISQHYPLSPVMLFYLMNLLTKFFRRAKWTV